MGICSLVPRPFEEEEKGPGTYCLRMLHYPKNLRGSDTIVYFLVYLPFDLYSSCFCEDRMGGLDGSIFEWDFEIAVAVPIGGGIWTWNSDGSRLARELSQRSGGHSVFFTCVGLFHYYTRGKDLCTENFTVVFTENLTHAQIVCTRPFLLLLLKGPGDETRVYGIDFPFLHVSHNNYNNIMCVHDYSKSKHRDI